MGNLFDSFGNPINSSEPKKSGLKKIWAWIKKHPRISLGALTSIISILAFLDIKSIFDIPKLYNKLFPNEISFTQDPGYKVLLLRFQPHENCEIQQTDIEGTIKKRLLEVSEKKKLGLQVIFDTLKPWPQTYDEGRKVGEEKGADLVIWGDLYERCYTDNEASLTYVVMDTTSYGIEKYGKSATEIVLSLADVGEGQLQQNIDYVIYWTLALEASSRKDCEQSQAYFSNIFEAFPQKSRNSYFELASCYYKSKNLILADSFYTKVIELNPNDCEAYNNRGVVKISQEKFLEAVADLNIAIQLNPKEAYPYYNRGALKEKQSDVVGAMTDYNIAIKLNPDYSGAYNNRGNLKKSLGDIIGAMGDFNKTIGLEPKNPIAFTNRGNLKAMQSDYKGALSDLNTAIQLDPDYANSYYNRGVIKMNRDDLNGAMADFKTATRLNPQDAAAYNNLAAVKLIQRDTIGALSDFSTSIRLNPQDHLTYNNRGALKVSKGDFIGALADFNEAILINPNDADGYFNRATVKFHQNDISNALANFNKAIEINPNYGAAYSNRGYIKEKQGDFLGAKLDYQKAIEINPSDKIAKNNLKKLQRINYH